MHAKPIFLILAAFLAAIQAGWTSAESRSPAVRPRAFSGTALTTYDKFLPLGLAGDAEIQNVLGYMFFYGEGVERDIDAAHWWFHLAAEQGNALARRNLGLLHSRTAPDVPVEYENAREANVWFRLAEQDMSGKPVTHPGTGGFDHAIEAAESLIVSNDAHRIGGRVYQRFCAGCHGTGGVSAYLKAPSFALGERLHKSDSELMHSMINGMDGMPAWGLTLSEKILSETLAYIRQHLANRMQVKSGQLIRMRENAAASRNAMDGRKLFSTYCAGCHGFNGIAYYVNSPSFAIGERMEKSDQELLGSIANGKGVMPGWASMLSALQRSQILSYVRALQAGYQSGIERGLPPLPSMYFRFRPHGERGDEWLGSDPRGIPPNR